MKESYPQALKHVLHFEGGYSDHPSDPGGATNLGITKEVLERFRGHAVTKQEVRDLTHDEAARIYVAYYWAPCRCDELPEGIDLAVFDCAVNQGVGRAARFLQQAAGVTADGAIGPKTIAAVVAAKPQALLTEFMARRMESYGSLQKLFKVFGLGWSRRLMATHDAAIAMRTDAAA